MTLKGSFISLRFLFLRILGLLFRRFLNGGCAKKLSVVAILRSVPTFFTVYILFVLKAFISPT